MHDTVREAGAVGEHAATADTNGVAVQRPDAVGAGDVPGAGAGVGDGAGVTGPGEPPI